MATVTVSQKGWVVIPAEIRRNNGIKPGDRLNVVEYAGFISLHPMLKNPVEEGMGILKSGSNGRGLSLTKALEQERAEERRRERRREKAWK